MLFYLSMEIEPEKITGLLHRCKRDTQNNTILLFFLLSEEEIFPP